VIEASGYAAESGTGNAVLVLDGQSRAAVETLQSLGRSGIAVDIAAIGDCLGRKSRYCRHALRQPDPVNAPRFLAWLEGLFAINNYVLVVPSTEASLRCLLLLPETHPIRRAAVLAYTRSIQVALDKQKTWELAKSLGVAVPASRLISSSSEAGAPKGFPVVLKPATSLVHRGGELIGVAPSVVRTRDEWSRALDRLLAVCPVQEQEYIPGPGVGIECLYSRGNLAWCFQHERLHELPLTGGGSSYRRAVPLNERLVGAATALLDRLEWHGVAMVEFKGGEFAGREDYRLMEINPRLWGSLALAIDAGVDFPKGLWRLAIGQEPGPQPRYRNPYYTRNLEMDFDWLKENLRADRSDPLLLTKPRLRSIVEYARPVLLVESWDHFDVKDWRIWLSIVWRTIRAAWQTLWVALRKAVQRKLIHWHHHRVLGRLVERGETGARRILFVCYGNICRSPVAEVYAKALRPDLEIASAGFHSTVDRTAPGWYRQLVSELGIDLTPCRSRRLDRAQVEWAQLILLADLDNFERFRGEFPEAMGKTTMLGLFLHPPTLEIEDPYSLAAGEARTSALAVKTAVKNVLLQLGSMHSEAPFPHRS
jgi:protein-tyrosine-phosphatase